MIKSLNIILLLAVGKTSFSSTVIEKIRPGSRNLRRSLVMVNIFEIFLDEYG